jgi:hypothetical protein
MKVNGVEFEGTALDALFESLLGLADEMAPAVESASCEWFQDRLGNWHCKQCGCEAYLCRSAD